MKVLATLAGLFTIAIINSGCPKPCIEANLAFSVNSQITPDKDSLHVGDTIYLVSSFPTTLIEQSTGQSIDYSGSTGIGSTLAVSNLPQGDTIAADAVFDFDYLNIKGKIYNDRSIPRPDGVQQLGWEQMANNYELRVGLIPKKKGDYILGLGNGLSNGRTRSRNCEKASFGITLSSTNQHFYLVYEWLPGIVLDDYGKQRVYYFTVY